MVIVVEFKPSEPTLPMWSFAQLISRTLELQLPKYEFEAVGEFLERYAKEFYNFKSIVEYDYWEHAFWMDPRQIMGDDD